MNKIYEKIYNKIHIKPVVAILTVIYGLLTYIEYCFKSLSHGKLSELSSDDARRKIMDIYKIPEWDNKEFAYSTLEYSQHVDLSVVVPAYNATNYIVDCLYSILNQETQYNYEVIVINDGSTDSTGTILENFKNNLNAKIIHQENKGIGATRNRGIEESCGKFLMFVDCDDVLLPGAIEYLLNIAVNTQADIVQGGFYRFSNHKSYHQKFVMPYKELSKSSKDIDLFLGYPWGKVYKKELWNKVRYPLELWFEDTVIKLIIFNEANRIINCDHIVYSYRSNDEGLSSLTKRKIKSLDTYFVIEKLLASAHENNLTLRFDNYFLDWFLKVQVTGLLWNRIQYLSDEIKESIFILTVDMIKEYGLNYSGQNHLSQKISNSFCEHNYQRWKVYAQYLSYRV